MRIFYPAFLINFAGGAYVGFNEVQNYSSEQQKTIVATAKTDF